MSEFLLDLLMDASAEAIRESVAHTVAGLLGTGATREKTRATVMAKADTDKLLEMWRTSRQVLLRWSLLRILGASAQEKVASCLIDLLWAQDSERRMDIKNALEDLGQNAVGPLRTHLSSLADPDRKRQINEVLSRIETG